ncbi:MAG: hypothetical protein DGJ47_001049 [Rickettsiaceae bacterium]
MTKSQKTLTPDFCIIGAGSGGLSFAAGAVQMGASVVLLEGRAMGGDCLNYGCVPSKSLIHAAKTAHQYQKSSQFSKESLPKFNTNFKKVHKHIQQVIANIAPNDSVERFEKLGVQVILESGAFKDDKLVVTDNYQIKAKCFIIATGSHAFIPPIKGIDDVPYLTNETLFDLKELPKHLVIIGGGPIGIEMAQSFNRLGSKVTVLEGGIALPKDEPEFTSRLKSVLVSEGVSLQEGVQVQQLSKSTKSVEVSFLDSSKKQQVVQASHLLIATGRRPNIKNLNLKATNITFSEYGIQVNKYMQTSVSNIYAIGDCSGGYQFTHAAGYHASIAIKNSIFRLYTKIVPQAIPWVTYTDPELAHVGSLESKLIEGNIKYKSLKMDFTDNDRAQSEDRTNGMIKVLVSPSGKVLGVTILGPSAGELVYPWVMLIQNNLQIGAIANSIAPYPTLNDINKRVAGSFYTDKIFSPLMQKIVRFILKWTRYRV